MSTEPKPTKETKRNPKEPKVVYSAQQRAQAVLAVWTERRRPGQVCRQMGITATLLAQWQERAMAGMLQALQPRRAPETQTGPALALRLEKMLARQALVTQGKLSKLEKRLAKLPVEPTVPASN
jgi:transposase-like protein